MQPCGCGTQLAVVVGVWEVSWVGLHPSDAGGASAPTPDMGGPDWVGVAGGQGDAGPPITDTGACLPSPGDDASTACATGSSALCSGEGVTVGVRGQGGPPPPLVTVLPRVALPTPLPISSKIQLRSCEGDCDPEEEEEEGESFDGSHGARGEGVGVVMVMRVL